MNSSARIAYVVGDFPSISETFILREVQELRKQGLEVKVFSLGRGWPRKIHPEAESLKGTVVYAGEFSSTERAHACFRLLFRDPGKLGQLLGICFRYMKEDLLTGLRALAKLPLSVMFGVEAERLGVQHVHAHFAYVTCDAARMMSAYLAGTYSVSAHAWDIYTQKEGLLKVRMEGAGFVSVCTESGRAALERIGRGCLVEKLQLIRHGVPLPDMEINEDREGGVVVAIGRLVEKKGIDVLVRSYSILKERGVRCNCIIVGEGPFRKRLEALVRSKGLADDVVFRGELVSNEVTALLKRASLLVHPSIVTAGGDRDGVPNVVLEAMAMGIPVVVTDASSAGEVVIDGVNGLIVEAEDEEALADSINELLEDDHTRIAMGREAREVIKKRFDVTRNVELIIGELARCLSDL